MTIYTSNTRPARFTTRPTAALCSANRADWASSSGESARSRSGPVFGSLIHHHGLRQMDVRGQAGGQKTTLLTVVAYNLKKLLKYRPNRQLSLAVALP